MNEHSWEVLEEKIIGIANNYFLARRFLKQCNNLTEDNFKLLCAYINNVRKAFSHLDEQEKVFINNEYFYEAPIYWWKKIITVNTYKKIKMQSVEHFLEAFYVNF